MKRFAVRLAGLVLLLMFSAAACAFAYSVDPTTGLYVDESGAVIAELWDEQAGLYIVQGVGYPIQDTDDPTYTGEEGTGTTGTGTGTGTKTEDGGLTIESGTGGTGETTTSTGTGLTQEEWEARMDRAIAANGSRTETVYTAPSGEIYPVEVAYIGLGRSEIVLNGESMLVPTCTLSWASDAPADQVLAVVTPARQSYLTMRAKKSQKAFVMAHCDKCRVLRVISTGKNWTLVDDQGLRGYVLTSGLTFYANEPREYSTGLITYKGRTNSNNTVHVRSLSKTSSRQIAEFGCGTPLTIFSQDEKWCEVDVGGWHCYIMSQFVTLDEPAVSMTTQASVP